MITVEINEEMMRNLLIGAMEGGSNYWYNILDYQYPTGTSADDFKREGKNNPSDEWPDYVALAFNPEGGGLLIGDVETSDPYSKDAAFQPILLNREAMIKGINLMAKEYPKHFADVINENDDANTADIFLQLSLLGEIIFG